VEGPRELRHVGDRAVDAELAERMRIGEGPASRLFRPDGLAPHLRESEEKTLLEKARDTLDSQKGD